VSEHLWEARDVRKSFGPTTALAGVHLQVRRGEIQALVGENGAGKSTLAKAACGVYGVDGGSFRLAGEPFEPGTLTAAAVRGVGLVFQESMVSPALSVAENVVIDRLRDFGRVGYVDRRRVRREAATHLAAAGADFDVDADWSTLNLGQRKMVELARAVSRRPRMLFVDEATAVLDATGRDLVLTALRRLRDQGVSICYVSHHLDEVFALADRITVMRDGSVVATLDTGAATRPELESLMVGREVASSLFPQRTPAGERPVVLNGKGVAAGSGLHGVDLSVRGGEVLGIAGLAGCGGSELLKAVAGELPVRGGRLTLHGQDYSPKTPRHAMRHGVAYLPGDRDGEGLLAGASVRENIGLTGLPGSLHPVRVGPERQLAGRFVESLRIKTSSVDQPVDGLSGGNRQKVVLAKLLALRPGLLLLDNPTRGVDVGARVHLYRAISDAIEAGTAVLLLSEDLPEVMGLSDRLLVLRGGRGTTTFPSTTGVSESQVLAHML